jgi:hypothetical protein
LAEYEFDIKFKKGEENSNADALSRLPIDTFQVANESTINVIINDDSFSGKVKTEQVADPKLIEIINKLGNTTGIVTIPFILTNGLLYFCKYDESKLLLIPQAMLPEFLELYNAHELSAHMSRDRLYQLLRKQFYWKWTFGDIRSWVSACPKCSKVKTNMPKQAGLLQPIITSQPFEMIAMDIMGPPKTSPEGYKYLLNIIDIFTSWPEAVPLKTLTAEETTKAFQILVTRNSCPMKVLSYRGTSFTSKTSKFIV